VLPDVVRDDVVAMRIRQWTPADGQRAAIEHVAAQRKAAWPDGLVSFSGYLETGGDGVFTYEQWATPAPPEDGEPEYRMYRYRRFDERVTPDCIVIVAVLLERPDLPRQWVDTVFGAFDEQSEPSPGLRGAHFHLSTDGARVVNYAEWASENAYDAAQFSNMEAIDASPKLRAVRDFSGVRNLVVRRYQPFVSFDGK
jgi:hypothetical protein